MMIKIKISIDQHFMGEKFGSSSLSFPIEIFASKFMILICCLKQLQVHYASHHFHFNYRDFDFGFLLILSVRRALAPIRMMRARALVISL